jgi:hypothetical protein
MTPFASKITFSSIGIIFDVGRTTEGNNATPNDNTIAMIQ